MLLENLLFRFQLLIVQIHYLFLIRLGLLHHPMFLLLLLLFLLVYDYLLMYIQSLHFLHLFQDLMYILLEYLLLLLYKQFLLHQLSYLILTMYMSIHFLHLMLLKNLLFRFQLLIVLLHCLVWFRLGHLHHPILLLHLHLLQLVYVSLLLRMHDLLHSLHLELPQEYIRLVHLFLLLHIVFHCHLHRILLIL